LVSNSGAIKNNRAHANERLIANGARMHDRHVANRDIVAHNAWQGLLEMEDCAVLDVGVMAHDDAVDVAAQNRVVPDAASTPRVTSTTTTAPSAIYNALAQGGLLPEETLSRIASISVMPGRE
jgi:hypothetical protein